MSVKQPGRGALSGLRDATLDTSYISMGSRRTESVHEFYRYPARFSPAFAEAALAAFSDRGDLVLDPFTGGGTTGVEARLGARDFIGADLNTLAVFVTRAKVALQPRATLHAIAEWAERVPDLVRLNRPVDLDSYWLRNGYLRNMNHRDTWRLRNAIALAIQSLALVQSTSAQLLARCAILRTGQWALDARRHHPSISDFRSVLASTAVAMSEAAAKFTEDVARANHELGRTALNRTIHEGVPGLGRRPVVRSRPSPRLILTSPPYPGVYMLYHRWKIGGRRESPAPFWVANNLDGHGQTYYTLAARSDPERNGYFEIIRSAYSDLAGMADRSTWLVQLVGFNAPDQLPRFLETMSSVGFEECRFEDAATESDGRLWRTVPGRRWWVTSSARQAIAPQTGREVVLFHRVKQ